MNYCCVYSPVSYNGKWRCDLVETDNYTAKIIVNACSSNRSCIIIMSVNGRNLLRFNGFVCGESRFDYYPESNEFTVDRKRKSTEHLNSILCNGEIELLKKQIHAGKGVTIVLYPKLLDILNVASKYVWHF